MTVLVHDYLLVMRGAERSFAAMADMWPGAPIATLLHDEHVFAERLAGHEVRTSPLQHLGARQRTFKALLPAMPWAVGRLDVSGHDLVVSSSSAFAHWVRPDEGATHVCYCYTPFRYAWYERELGIQQAPRLTRPLVRRTLDRIQRLDHEAAQRRTRYVAISRISQERIHRYWAVDADIVHPPVELARFSPAEREDYVLVVCELVAHKRVDIALEAARRAGVRAKVVGGGVDEPRLRARFGGGVDFLGRVSDAQLATLYPRARALVMPNTEEFGITAVEAQASGVPVVAADAGGARETVIDGRTGFLVPPDEVDALAEVLRSEALARVDAGACMANAQRFSVKAFQAGIREQVSRAQREPR